MGFAVARARGCWPRWQASAPNPCPAPSSATLTFPQGRHDQPDGEGGATATARMESPLSPGEDQPGKHVPRGDTVATPAWRAPALEASTPPRRVLVEHFLPAHSPGWTADDPALGTNTDQHRGHRGLARGGTPSSPAQAPARGLQAFLSRLGAELVTSKGCRPTVLLDVLHPPPGPHAQGLRPQAEKRALCVLETQPRDPTVQSQRQGPCGQVTSSEDTGPPSSLLWAR